MELLLLAMTLLLSVGVSLAAARTMLGAAFLLMARPVERWKPPVAGPLGGRA